MHISEFIFHPDETCRRFTETPRSVLAEKGTETVEIKLTSDEKLSFTTVGTISPEADKLPF
jgi:hypothetical protein